MQARVRLKYGERELTEFAAPGIVLRVRNRQDSSGANPLRGVHAWGTKSAVMAQQDLTGEIGRTAVDRTRSGQHGGSIGLVLLIAVALVGAAVALLFIGRSNAEPYILALLAVLAMIGVFLLFALAAGILHASGQEGASPLLKSVVDAAGNGILVTDGAGRVLYANAAYLALIGASASPTIRRSRPSSSRAIPISSPRSGSRCRGRRASPPTSSARSTPRW